MAPLGKDEPVQAGETVDELVDRLTKEWASIARRRLQEPALPPEVPAGKLGELIAVDVHVAARSSSQ